jgi:hypothetical protein
MPDRLSDIVNVKDWNAKGDDATDDANAIQAAINFCISRGGGKVFFPPGIYRIGQGLVVGASVSTTRVELIGSGRGQVTWLRAQSNTFTMFSKGGNTYDALGRLEAVYMNANIGVLATGVNQQIHNCDFKCHTAVDASQASGMLISDSTTQGIQFSQRADNAVPWPTSDVGFYLGDSCTALDCRLDQTFIGYSLSGSGAAVIGCAAENHVTTVRMGWAPQHTLVTSASSAAGTNILTFALLPNSSMAIGRGVSGTNIPASTTITAIDRMNNKITVSNNFTSTGVASGATITFAQECPAYGCMVQNLQTERSNNGIDLYHAHGCLIQGLALTGAQPFADYAPIQNIKWSGGVATVSTAAVHNLASGSQWLRMQAPSAFLPTADPDGFGGYIYITRTSTTQFTYALAVNPGDYTPGTADWNYPLYTSLKCRIVTECAIISSGLGANVAYGSVDLDCNGEAQHRNNMMMGILASCGWRMPSVSGNIAGWKFSGAGQATVSSSIPMTNPTKSPGPQGVMRYADLPGVSSPGSQTYYQPVIEGQEYDIVDCNVSSWGATAGGNGSVHARVRYNGSQWIVIG